jgi:acetyl esterase/lipase
MKHLRLAFLLVVLNTIALAADAPNYTRTEDVIYGRKFGMALTLDVIKPKENPNGLGIIYCVSGGWFSSHDNVPNVIGASAPYLKRGYTIFAVVHGSNPKYTIPEVVKDMHRAVRFVRFHAKDYGIDPDKIGITGGSAGGHLSLMMGTTGDNGDENAKDPIDKISSKVQCVACFFPPTDFLNYSKPGESAVGVGILANFFSAFDFHDFDPKLKKFVAVTDPEKIKEIARNISPAQRADTHSAPALIAHGDADKLVPIQQAEIMIEKLKALNVDCKLVTHAGGGHGWKDMQIEVEQFADWFDAHLKAK